MNKFSLKDQSLLFRRLGDLLHAGVPLIEALRLLKEHHSKDRFSTLIEAGREAIRQGKPLSHGFKITDQVHPYAIHLIAIGETSGSLPETFLLLAEEFAANFALRRKLIGSLMYPGLVVSAALAIVGLLVFYMIPKIVPVFESLAVPLPWSTRVLIRASEFPLSSPLFLVAIPLLFIGILLLRKYFSATVWFLVSRLPLLRNILRNYALSIFCRTLGQLLQRNISILRALQLAQTVVTVPGYQRNLPRITVVVTQGTHLSKALGNTPQLFPPLLIHLVATGERTGTLGPYLIHASALYERELREWMERITALIEPLLMIGLGLLIGSLALSILMPIYEISSHITH